MSAMAIRKKTPSSASQELRALKRENAELKTRLQQLEAERDGYRRMVHAWAKANISAADLLEWDREDEDSGQTLLDVIAQFQKRR